jgi:hypothetical protein
VKLQSLATTEQLRLNYDATNYNAFTVGATGSLTVAATGTNPDIRLTPGGTGYTILDGNVGISTSVPLGKLIVQGAGTTTGITFATQNSAATRLVTMLDSGNVGIGSTAPMARMVIWGAGTTSSTSSFMVRDSAGTGRLTVQDGGNVGVGTSVPTSTLQVVTTGTLGIPVGTGPTTATAGQIAIDTTDDQFLYYGAATRVLSYKQSRAFTIEYPLDTDNFLLFKTFDPITITDIECIVDPTDSGDSVVITIQERDSAGINPGTVEAVTCDYNGASDDGTFTDSAIAANGWVGVDIGTVTGAVGQLVVTVYYTINAE